MTWWVLLQIAAAQVLGGAGAMIVLWGLAGDRLRGGHTCRRCPRCWHDLTGTPGLTCPECGRTARRERALFRTRRRWWLATLGVLVLLGGMVTAVRPWERSSNIARLLPLWARVELHILGWTWGDGTFEADLRAADLRQRESALDAALRAGVDGKTPGADEVLDWLLERPSVRPQRAAPRTPVRTAAGPPRTPTPRTPAPPTPAPPVPPPPPPPAVLSFGHIDPELVRAVLKTASSRMKDAVLREWATNPGGAAAYLDEIAALAMNTSDMQVADRACEVLAVLAQTIPAAHTALARAASPSTPHRMPGFAVKALLKGLPATAPEVTELLRSRDNAASWGIATKLRDLEPTQTEALYDAFSAILRDPNDPAHHNITTFFEGLPCSFNTVLDDLLAHADGPTVSDLLYGLQRREDECMAALLPGVKVAALRDDLPMEVRRKLVHAHEYMRSRSRANVPPLVVPGADDPTGEWLLKPEGPPR